MERLRFPTMKILDVVCIGVLAVIFACGCGNDPSGPREPQVDLLVGYWGVVSTQSDGNTVRQGDGSDLYWVIYSGNTVCLIEKLPSGEYEKDSTFIYERNDTVFTARFDLDPVPLPQPALPMTYQFSANSDTLYFAWEEVESWSTGRMVLVRQSTIPSCGCDTIP